MRLDNVRLYKVFDTRKTSTKIIQSFLNKHNHDGKYRNDGMRIERASHCNVIQAKPYIIIQVGTIGYE